MKKELKTYTAQELCEGFMYSELEQKGLFGLAGELVIQPEYQRHYLYSEGKGELEIAVIDSIVKDYPLGVLYFYKRKDGLLEVLDGQQRITSIGRFLTNKFSYMIEGRGYKFDALKDERLRERILNTKLAVYEIECSDIELTKFFEIVNMQGIRINEQERRNAAYFGPFVTLAKKEFSNSKNANVDKWSHYMNGNVKRQEYLECALDWVSEGNIERYMIDHRNDTSINELTDHFNDVIVWVESIFTEIYPEMRHVNWGRLYKTYHEKPYNSAAVSKKVRELMDDDCINDYKGIFEYVLGGCEKTNLLDVRVFDKKTKRSVYNQQTAAAKEKGESNCPLCAIGHDANRQRIWKLDEMDADHVTAFGSLTKWMPTMSPHGAREVQQVSRTARCCARHITKQKETDNIKKTESTSALSLFT